MNADVQTDTLADCREHLSSLQRQVSYLERMVQISQMLNSTLDLRQLLQLIIQTAAELVGAQAASILLEDARSGELCFVAATGSSYDELSHIKVPVEGSIAGKIFKSGQHMIVGDVRSDPRHFVGVDQSIEFETRSLLGVPLRVRQRSIGVLEALNKSNGVSFNQEDVRTLSALAAHAAVAIDNARLVAQLQDANRRLAELDRLKSDFISIASHELRTPLTLVLGYASYLQEQAPGEVSEEVEMVVRGATHLQGLIETMTNLRYLESGTVQLERQRFALQGLIAEVCEKWEPLAANQRLTFLKRLPAMPIFVYADWAKISLVLSNLLHNAVRFTPAGGTVQLSVRPETGRVAIVVSDTGIGIPQQELGRIFDRFYQVEPHMTRHYGGMGLGLSIARGMVELHGGRIWADSLPGQGSQFTFTLPIHWDQRNDGCD